MSDCVEGVGFRSGRGGHLQNDRGYVHRVAWEEVHGKIPPKMIIHHECGNPRCTNVEHLRMMSRSAHSRLHYRLRRAEKRQKKRVDPKADPLPPWSYLMASEAESTPPV